METSESYVAGAISLINLLADRQPKTLELKLNQHLNIIIASLTFGGAERVVQELVATLQRRNVSGHLFVLNTSDNAYPLTSTEHFQVVPLGHLPRNRRLEAAAVEILTSPNSLVFTHLVRSADLQILWKFGITTIPVVHNARLGWQDPPELYNHSAVPFLVGCCEAVARELRESGCSKPVIALRHELQSQHTPEFLKSERIKVRRRHGIADGVALIGMIGQFKAQKAYTRAVRVLAEVRRHLPAKLMILGGWDHSHGFGRPAQAATCRLALELEVMADLLLMGPVNPVAPYLAAFDVYLQTSVYEGLSIAFLEALATGCPSVVTDVGGNSEVAPDHVSLIAEGSGFEAYAQAVFDQLGRPRLLPPARLKSDLIARIWLMLGRHGLNPSKPEHPQGFKTLFVTSNLNIGGAQRSLVNLLVHLPPENKSCVCVLDKISCVQNLDALENAGISVLSISNINSTVDRVDHIMELSSRLNVKTICFWNAPAEVKLLIAKVAEAKAIRLVDVSPGPMLFQELEAADQMRRRLSLPRTGYFDRLDAFIAKYPGGAPPPEFSFSRNKLFVIPNGVPLVPNLKDLPAWTPAAERDPNLILGTCCRIAPMKRIEFLVELADLMAVRRPEATVCIVGGFDPRHVEYWQSLQEAIAIRALNNLQFVGPQIDVKPFLKSFRVFVMISDNQGCPNASLEAMAMGLPVVANNSGGTELQVVDGVTGFLVSDIDPSEMADRVVQLLNDTELARRLGETGRDHAVNHYSMRAMVKAYGRVLFDSANNERISSQMEQAHEDANRNFAASG